MKYVVIMKCEIIEISCNRKELEEHKSQEIQEIKSQQQSSTATDIDSEFLTPMAAYVAYLIIKTK